MVRTYKYRVFSTKAQRTLLRLWLELCRWVYNKSLELRKNAWEKEHKTVSQYELNKLLPSWKKEKPELSLVQGQVLQNVQARLAGAFSDFFRRVRNHEKPGYPRFKSEERYHSLTWPQLVDGFHVTKATNTVKLSRIGKIKANIHREYFGTPKTATLKVSPTGKWFLYVAVELAEAIDKNDEKPDKVSSAEQTPDKQAQPEAPIFTALVNETTQNKAVGVDVGLTSFLTTDTGETVANPRFYRKKEKELHRVQRRYSKATSYTPVKRKRLKAVVRVHERIRNKRDNFVHQVANKIVAEADIICLEDITPSKMVHNHCLAKSISDAAWGKFKYAIIYKAEEAGKLAVLVPPGIHQSRLFTLWLQA